MPIDSVLRLHARNRPGKTAIIEGERRIDYATLNRLVDGAAHRLHASGVRREMLVGLALRDHAEHLVALFALARIGAVILPMDCRWHTEEKRTLASHFKPDVVLLEGDDPAAPECGWTALEHGWVRESDEPYLDEAVTDGSPLVLSLSSGTTGLPKGPRATHRQFESRFMVYWVNLGLNAQDVYVSITPLYFGGGRAFNMAMLFAGGTVSILSPRTKMPALAEHVREVGGTVIFLVPTMIRRMLDERLPGLAFPTLRVLISSGSALHADERTAIREQLTPNLFEFYSSTEGGGVSVLSPADCDRNPDSVGRPGFRVEVEIVDEGHAVLPSGSVGRLRYRSPASARGYYGAEGSDAFRDGWFYPGDLARLDAEGFLYLHGRAKDMIIRGGVNIYPQDVERVISGLAGVRDVAVAGAPSREMGEEVAAFLVTDGTVTAEAVVAHCRTRLAPYKVPSILRFLGELPRNNGGKVLKPALLETLKTEAADAN
ncbi:class I adenylate-forming enzyme family protein [Roseomonas xinghualingensis]|uniref:class I adenylate-forming enzyme family protein n=1 Tax=Roseomonas xinghualingensis TaxID=2986475 RepID=UPI0021F11A61|nr:AMP-binding protein [Roseomonas sp. SXEYE001]MCV4210342.1 AMP-binding protein [Roseomonas sp. SXEYE001]